MHSTSASLNNNDHYFPFLLCRQSLIRAFMCRFFIHLAAQVVLRILAHKLHKWNRCLIKMWNMGWVSTKKRTINQGVWQRFKKKKKQSSSTFVARLPEVKGLVNHKKRLKMQMVSVSNSKILRYPPVKHLPLSKHNGSYWSFLKALKSRVQKSFGWYNQFRVINISWNSSSGCQTCSHR